MAVDRANQGETERGADAAPLRDEPGRRPVAESRTLHHGMVFDLVRDEVDFAPGVRFAREYLRHGGAVAVLALDEGDGPEGAPRVLLIRQYRHPAGGTFWELPAGLLDVPGEDAEQAARRELAEETGCAASTMEPLLTLSPTCGSSEERIQVFCARGIRPAEGLDFERRDEEAELEQRWAPLADVVQAVLEGRLHNGTLVAAVLALAARRRADGA